MSLAGTLQARSNTSDRKRLCKCLGAKFLEQKQLALGKGLLLDLIRDLNEIDLTLLEKDLDAVVHESESETKETGLETVELRNGGKSAWFNLKYTAIL